MRVKWWYPINETLSGMEGFGEGRPSDPVGKVRVGTSLLTP